VSSQAAFQPSLFSQSLWQKRVNHYLAVFERALLLLREDEGALYQESEPQLSRRLHFKLLVARRELDPNGIYGHPERESENLPDPEETEIQPHEAKKPDFQWKHDDTSISDPRFALKSYTIECKRLGAKTQSSWKLNENYFNHGLMRFYSPTWKYGLGVAEGAMIGFVQNMKFDEILTEINGVLTTSQITPLVLGQDGWKPKHLSKLSNEIVRSFRETHFTLIHLWIDLRQ